MENCSMAEIENIRKNCMIFQVCAYVGIHCMKVTDYGTKYI